MMANDVSPLHDLKALAVALGEVAAAPPASLSAGTASAASNAAAPSTSAAVPSATAAAATARSRSEVAPRVQLRDYQEELASSLVQQLRRKRRAAWRHTMVYLPTGAGKTVVAGTVIARHLERYGGAEGASDKENSRAEEPLPAVRQRRGARCLFVVNRCTLVEQTARALSLLGLSPGFIKAGLDEDPGAAVQIATIQTLLSLRRRGAREAREAGPSGAVDSSCSSSSSSSPPLFELIVVDEAHCVLAPQYAELLRLHPDACVIGLTATPFRLAEGERLSGVFGQLLRGPSVAFLVKEGHLVPPVVLAPSTAPFSALRTNVAQSDEVLDSAVRRWRERCAGRRTIAFCCTVRQSEALVARFRGAGVRAWHVDGTTHEAERELRFRSLADGDALVLSSVGVLSEGFDLPAVEVVLLMRPTDSKGLFLQQVGRGLRCAEGKRRCVVLDEVGNSYRHGPIDGPLCAGDWDAAHVLPLEVHPEEDQRKAKAKGESLRNLLKFCQTKGCHAFIDKRSDRTRCALCREAARARRERNEVEQRDVECKESQRDVECKESQRDVECEESQREESQREESQGKSQRESQGKPQRESQGESRRESQRGSRRESQGSADVGDKDGRVGRARGAGQDRPGAVQQEQVVQKQVRTQQQPQAKRQPQVQHPLKQVQQIEQWQPHALSVSRQTEQEQPQPQQQRQEEQQHQQREGQQERKQQPKSAGAAVPGTQEQNERLAKGGRASAEHVPGKQDRAARTAQSGRASAEHAAGTQKRGERVARGGSLLEEGGRSLVAEGGRSLVRLLAPGASRDEPGSKGAAPAGHAAPREQRDEAGELGALLASKLQVSDT